MERHRPVTGVEELALAAGLGLDHGLGLGQDRVGCLDLLPDDGGLEDWRTRSWRTKGLKDKRTGGQEDWRYKGLGDYKDWRTEGLKDCPPAQFAEGHLGEVNLELHHGALHPLDVEDEADQLLGRE